MSSEAAKKSGAPVKKINGSARSFEFLLNPKNLRVLIAGNGQVELKKYNRLVAKIKIEYRNITNDVILH